MYRLASVLTDPSQNTPQKNNFRQRFAANLCTIEGLPKTGPRYDYSIPVFYDKTRWLVERIGKTITPVAGTNYTDLSKSSNRTAIAEGIDAWLDEVDATGVLLDCLNLAAPGQLWYAVDLFREIKEKIGVRIAMVNFGDVYSWAASLPDTPWGTMRQEAAAHLPQVAIELGTRFSGSQFSRAIFQARTQLDAGKIIVLGLYDYQGKAAAQAVQMIQGAAVLNEAPGFYWHYNTDPTAGAPVEQQWPVGLPLTIPDPEPIIELGINSDMHRSRLYRLATNPWNQDVRNAPRDPDSAAIISRIVSYDSATGGRMHPDFNKDYGMPITVVDHATPRRNVSFAYASESDNVPYPIPDSAIGGARRLHLENNEDYYDANREGDAHLLLYERDQDRMYEISYFGVDANANLRGGAGAVFDLKTDARRPEGYTSTDAAGLCVAAGLIRPDEVFGDGPIDHAIRFAIKQTNGHVYPASHTGARNTGAPPLGIRLVMKASVDLSWIAQPWRKIFEAMKIYGIICADRGSNMHVQGVMDPRFDAAVLNPIFHKIRATDFEVIKLGWRP